MEHTYVALPLSIKKRQSNAIGINPSSNHQLMSTRHDASNWGDVDGTYIRSFTSLNKKKRPEIKNMGHS